MGTVFWGLIVTITLFWVSLPFILAAQPKTKSGDFKDADKVAAELNAALGGHQPSGEEAEIPLNNPPKGGGNVMSGKELFAELRVDKENAELIMRISCPVSGEIIESRLPIEEILKAGD